MINYFVNKSEHPAITKPYNEDIAIWRYMDIAKFLSLLDSKALYFCRADINQKDDPFEGATTQMNLERFIAQLVPYIGLEKAQGIARQYPNKAYIARNVVFNCWHMNEHESAAMWKIYTNNNQGIAIQSTYNALIASIPPLERKQEADDRVVYVGQVRYIDYSRDTFSPTDAISPFMHKRMSFEHERELRAIIIQFTDELNFDHTAFPDGGALVPVDLNILIRSIYIAPGSPSWYKNIIESVIGKFGYRFSVNQSTMNSGPVW